jgi:putative protease
MAAAAEFAPPYAVELLAPAGCFPSLQAAISAGADAVYFGLAQLNMRARARRSFELDDLAEIMGRCKAGGVRGFLTLNTILYDHDLPVARRMLAEAARCDIDGVIVSDMAAIQMALELDLEVHLSTQLSLSNYEAVKFYAAYCDRVVLARELNLKMIKKLHRRILKENLCGRSGKLMEIEAFAHGALCIAVSGRCGMSLFTDNASANRGACSQNCRREYEVTDKKSGEKMVIDNNFVMSPNDIATIDFMDQFLESGVSVLKLEGRGRPPEYVHAVVHAYRRAVDAVNNGSYNPAMVEELYKELDTVFNRGMSSGYYLGRKQGWAAGYGNRATHRKVFVGDVNNYYKKIGIAEITVKTTGIQCDDDYVIVGNKTGVVKGKISEMRLDDARVSSVAAQDVFCIPVPEPVRRNDKLYKLEPVNAAHQS